MNKTVLSKIILFLGYLLFASFSAYFTSTSLSLNLMQGTNLWLIFAMVFVIALLAGWCLNNIVVQITNPTSKAAFIFNIIGFVMFWGFSFTTNVHYFFVDKHGYDVVSKELNAAKNYIVQNTADANKKIDDERDMAKSVLVAQVSTYTESFEREINNTMEHHIGFGDACINILNSIERLLEQDKAIYGDNNTYVIFDEERDMGDRGKTQRNQLSPIQTKYKGRILNALNKKLGIIDAFYNGKKDANNKLKGILRDIQDLEDNHLPIVLKDGSVNALFMYHEQQNARVITKMPQDFIGTCENIDEGTKEVKKYEIYPSNHMFDTLTVWDDMINSRLPEYMKMFQWILISLIIDVVAFLLFTLFCKKN